LYQSSEGTIGRRVRLSAWLANALQGFKRGTCASERFKADVRDMGFDDEVRDPWQR
jgi:hypothetical protein